MITSIGMIHLEMHSLGVLDARGLVEMCVGVRFCVLYSFWSGRSESVAGPSDIATTPTCLALMIFVVNCFRSHRFQCHRLTFHDTVPGMFVYRVPVQQYRTPKKMKTFALHDPKQVPKPKMEAKALQAHPNMQRLPTMRLFETFPPCQRRLRRTRFDS